MEENEGEVKGKYNDIKREVALFFSLKCLISFFRIKMFRFEYLYIILDLRKKWEKRIFLRIKNIYI